MTQLDALKSPRFGQIATFARLPHTKSLEGVHVAFVGIPFDDAVTFKPGARLAPQAVRESSRILRPYNAALDVKPFEALNIVDYGDIDIVPGYIEDSFARIEAGIDLLSDNGVVPLVCGGDHSVTLPVLRSLADRFGELSLIHVDAHSDCWTEYWGHKYTNGTTFRRSLEEGLIDPRKSIQIGIRGSLYGREDLEDVRSLGFTVVTAEEVHERGVDHALRLVRDTVSGQAYFSFDIDGMDPAYAPGTGTPEVGGLTSWQALGLVRGLVDFSFVGFDLVEVSPVFDPAGITSLLAANLLYEFLSVLAKGRQLQKARSN